MPRRGHIPTQATGSRDGSVTVKAKGIPAGDILVVGFKTTVHGSTVTSGGGSRLTSPPAPNCVSPPPRPRRRAWRGEVPDKAPGGGGNQSRRMVFRVASGLPLIFPKPS